MNCMPTTFAEVISLWVSAAELARDLKIQDLTARAWRQRDSIPAEYWPEIERAAERRGFGELVSVKLLAEIAARSAGRPVGVAANG